MTAVTAALAVLACGALASCASSAAGAEEYFALGTAYFDLGKYAEAENWFNKARTADKTRTASEYNLGRIAFETGRYEEAAARFDRVLKTDPQNITALKAAAYTRVKTGEAEKALEYYRRVLELVPENADSGYNYALLLNALGKNAEAETVLLRYKDTAGTTGQSSQDSGDALLLLARTRRALDKTEALDDYSLWLAKKKNPQVHFEYAELLEKNRFYARALEEYGFALESGQGEMPPAPLVKFRIARTLLAADPSGEAAVTALREAAAAGFSGPELDALLADPSLSQTKRDELLKTNR